MKTLAATSSVATTIAPIRPVLSISLFSETNLSSIPNPRPIANMPMMNITFGSAPPRKSIPCPPENDSEVYVENALPSGRHLLNDRRIVYHIRAILLKHYLITLLAIARLYPRQTPRRMQPSRAPRPPRAGGRFQAAAPARSRPYRRSHSG